MTLSSSDYKQLLALIDIAHSHLDRAAMFEAVCKKMGELIALSGAVFIPVDSGTGRFCFPARLSFSTSDRNLILFSICYAPMHPVVMEELRLNEPVHVTDILPDSRMANLVYGQGFEYSSPLFYEYCCALNSFGEIIGILAFHRGDHDSEFSDKEKELLRLFLPHLARAFHNLEMMETINSSLEIGVVVSGDDGRPVYINDFAKLLIGEKDVDTFLKQDLSSIPSSLQTETGNYRVRVVPTHPNGKEKIILLEPLQGSNDIRLLLKNFKLSPKQEEIASLAMCGLCNQEIAERFHITEQTVKDHLRNIFEKIHVHSRSQLTAKVLGLNSKG